MNESGIMLTNDSSFSLGLENMLWFSKWNQKRGTSDKLKSPVARNLKLQGTCATEVKLRRFYFVNENQT